MKMKNNKFLSILLCLTLLIAVVSPMTVAKAAATIEENGYCADISGYRGENGVLPTKENKIFAGWYDGADFTTADPILPSQVDGEAYAKFIDPLAFTIKNQFKAETTKASAETDLRIITTIDSLNYTSIEFMLEKNDVAANKSIEVTTVYTSLVNNKNGEDDYTPGDQFENSNSAYFAVEKLTGIGYVNFADKIEITPVYHTYDGTTVTGTTREFRIKNEAPLSKTVVSDFVVGAEGITFTVDEADTMANATSYAADIYVDGVKSTTATLTKTAASAYLIEGVTVADGTEVSISGELASDYQSIAIAQNPGFIYDAETVYEYDDIQTFVSWEDARNSYASNIGTGNLRFTPSTYIPADLWADSYTAVPNIYGGFYFNDSETAASAQMKKFRQDVLYLLYQDLGFTPVNGSVITVDGIFGNEAYAARVKETTFVYDATLGIFVQPNEIDETVAYDLDVDVKGFYSDYDLIGGKTIRMTPLTDFVAQYYGNGAGTAGNRYYSAVSGGVYVNGSTTPSNIPLNVWRYDVIYIDEADMTAAGVTVQDGTTITVEGVFEDSEGQRIKLERLTWIYDATLDCWCYYVYQAQSTVYDTARVDKNLLLGVVTNSYMAFRPDHTTCLISTGGHFILKGAITLSYEVEGQPYTAIVPNTKGLTLTPINEARWWLYESVLSQALATNGHTDMTAVDNLTVQVDVIVGRSNGGYVRLNSNGKAFAYNKTTGTWSVTTVSQ